MSRSEQTLEYRAAFRFLFYVAIAVAVLAEVLLIWFHRGKYLDDTLRMVTIRLVVISALPVFSLVYLIVFIRPKLFFRYWLDPHRLFVDDRKEEYEIGFKNIKTIKFSMPLSRFFGGFTIMDRDRNRFHFSSALTGNYLILQAIEKDRPDLVSRDRLGSYMYFANMVDASWARLARKVRRWPLLAGKYLLLPCLLSVYWQKQHPVEDSKLVETFLLVFGSHALFVALWGGFINHLEERIFEWQYFKQKVRQGDQIHWAKPLSFGAQVVFLTTVLIFYYLKFVGKP